MTKSLGVPSNSEEVRTEILLGDNTLCGSVTSCCDLGRDLLGLIQEPADELLGVTHVTGESGLRSLDLDSASDKGSVVRLNSGGGDSVRQENIPVTEDGSLSTRKLVDINQTVNKETCVSLNKQTGNVRRMGIAENLIKLRTEAGLSQTRLAKLAGVSQQLISQLESDINASTKKLPAIAKVFGVPVAAIDPNFVEVNGNAERVPFLSWPDMRQLARKGTHPALRNPDFAMTVGELKPGTHVALKMEDSMLDRVAPPGSFLIVSITDEALESGRFYVFFDEVTDAIFVRRYQDDPPTIEPFSIDPPIASRPLRDDYRAVARVEMVITKV